VGTRFLFGTLLFTAGEDDPEHPSQEQEEWHTTMTDFEFSRGFGNSATTLQRPGISQLLHDIPGDRQIGDVQCSFSLSSGTQPQSRFQHWSGCTPSLSRCSVWPRRDVFHAPGPARGRTNVTDRIPDPESICAQLSTSNIQPPQQDTCSSLISRTQPA
jgi:hypothetical protein